VPDVAAAEAAGKVAVLPGVVEMKAGFTDAVVVTDPFAVVVDVRRLGMAWFIAGGRLARRGMRGWRAVFGNVSAAHGMAAAMLRDSGE